MWVLWCSGLTRTSGRSSFPWEALLHTLTETKRVNGSFTTPPFSAWRSISSRESRGVWSTHRLSDNSRRSSLEPAQSRVRLCHWQRLRDLTARVFISRQVYLLKLISRLLIFFLLPIKSLTNFWFSRLRSINECINFWFKLWNFGLCLLIYKFKFNNCSVNFSKSNGVVYFTNKKNRKKIRRLKDFNV